MIEDLFVIKGNLRVYKGDETNKFHFWSHFLLGLHDWRRKGRRREEEEEEEEEEEGEEQMYVFLYGIKCILMSRVIGVIVRVFLWRLVCSKPRVLVERSS